MSPSYIFSSVTVLRDNNVWSTETVSIRIFYIQKAGQGHELQRRRIYRWMSFVNYKTAKSGGFILNSFSLVYQRGVQTHIHIHIQIQLHIHIHTHARTRAHTHTRTHTYGQTHILRRQQWVRMQHVAISPKTSLETNAWLALTKTSYIIIVERK